MASSKPILRAEEVAMREAGAKADTLTREARAKILANIFISRRGIICEKLRSFSELDAKITSTQKPCFLTGLLVEMREKDE